MSSSFGGGGRGEIRYVISVDDAQAVQKLQGVGQQFQQLGQSGQQATQGLQQLPQTLDQTAQAGDKVSQSQNQMGQAVEQSTTAVKEQGQAQQSFGSVVKQNIQAIVQIGSGIVGLVANYYSLQRVQLQINKLEVTEANQRRMLGVLTRQHAAAVAEYGANSQEAMDIENKINILQAKHTNTLDQLSIRQEQANLGMINFGLSVVQTGAGLVQAAGSLKTFAGAADTAKVATNGLRVSINGLKVATVIGAILVGIEVAAQAVANNFGGFRDKIEELYNWLVKIAPAFQPVIDAIWTIGQALTALFTGDIDSLTKMFSQSAAAAPAAIAGVDDTGDSINEMGKQAGKAQKEIDDMWKEISEAPNLTSALNIEVDKDKLTKKLLDYLPDKLTKDIKLFIKGRESVETLRDSFSEILSLATDMGKDDKWADKFVNQTIKVLKEKFPKAPGSKELQDALATTVSGPDTLQKAKALIEKWKLDPALKLDTSKITVDEAQKDALWDKLLPNPGESKGKDTSTHVVGILDKIKAAITNFDWTGTADTILSGILEVSESAGSKISEWVKGTFTIENFQKGLDKISDLSVSFATALWAILADPKETAKNINTFVTNTLTALGQWFIQSFPKTSKKLLQLGEMITNEIYKGLISYVNFGSEALNWISEQITASLKSMWQVGADIAGQIWEGMKSWFSGKNVFDLFGGTDKKLEDEFTKKPDWWPTGFGGIPGTPNSNPPAGDMMKQGMWVDNNGTLRFGANPNYGKGDPKFNQLPISYGSGGGKALSDSTKSMEGLKKPLSQFASLISDAQAAGRAIRTALGTALQDVYDTMVDVAKQWSTLANSFGKNSTSAGKQIRTAFAKALQDVYDTMSDLAGQWSKLCNSMGKNAASAGKQIRSAFGKALQDVYDTMKDLANQWSKLCNSLINNAKSAASGINKALGSIKDVTVKVNVQTTGATQYLAKGGIISAARGFTTNGPQLLMVGDNPGGRETIAAIPNNAPANMMNKLNSKFGTGGGDAGNITLNVTLPISGNEIINERKLSQKIRFEIGRDMDKFGSS